MIELIDSHTHLDSEQFEGEVEEILARARAAGVTQLVTIGAGGGGFVSAENAIALSEKYDFVFATAGVHPHDTETPLDRERLLTLASHPRVRAIGETGLDFYRDWAPVDKQYEWFRVQVEIALEVKKPLVIHSRDAGKESLKVLTEMNASEVGGVFHCYQEDADFAVKLTEINFIISVPGSITFKKADEFREAIRQIPLAQIMVETDAPYLSPEPYRGKRCESSYVIETAKRIAEVKNISFEEVARVTTENARRFYQIEA